MGLTASSNMRTLRPITVHIPKRPSIHEIAASILTPTTSCCRARQFHRTFPSIRSTANPNKRRHPVLSSQSLYRTLHSSPSRSESSSHPPKSHDRGPPSKETTQTDFPTLDVLGGTPAPSTSIDACVWDGFHLNSGAKITNGAGVLLLGGESFGWRPWNAGKSQEGKRLLNDKGQWEVDDEAWGVLEVVWPKPGMSSLPLDSGAVLGLG
jgi:NADH dehydrogenase [ubiquinone] 1 alpha subcomplex assembly factor 3